MAKMKMLVAMVAMLAMLLVTAAPAMAQPIPWWFDWGEDVTSGDLDQDLSYSVKGNNNVCGSPVQIGNTGNVDNTQNVGGRGNSVHGGYIEQSPIVTTQCNQR